MSDQYGTDQCAACGEAIPYCKMRDGTKAICVECFQMYEKIKARLLLEWANKKIKETANAD